MLINVLAVGDVVGKPGIEMLERHLRALKKIKAINFTIVNGENASGVGITPAQAEQIFNAGADVITLGNHTWRRKEIVPFIADNRYILRPANFAPQTPGRGWGVFDANFAQVCVVSLIGRFNMDMADSPFFEADKVLKQLKKETNIVIVDLHAEATSEKLAMAYYLDGRVSAIFGTHTHVQTSDDRVFPKGTGYITDAGMTGPVESVLGTKASQAVSYFLGNVPTRFDTASGPCKLEGVVFGIDTATGKCETVERLRIND